MIDKIFYKKKKHIHCIKPCFCNLLNDRSKKPTMINNLRKTESNIFNKWRHKAATWSKCWSSRLKNYQYFEIKFFRISKNQNNIICNFNSINFLYINGLKDRTINISIINSTKQKQNFILFLYTTKNQNVKINIKGNLNNKEAGFLHIGEKNYGLNIDHYWSLEKTKMCFYDKISGFKKKHTQQISFSLKFFTLLDQGSKIKNVCKIQAVNKEKGSQSYKSLILDKHSECFCLPKLISNGQNVLALDHSVKIINLSIFLDFFYLRGINNINNIKELFKKKYEG